MSAENKEFERQFLAGELESSSTRKARSPSGCGAGGAGIPAFYTRTGVGRRNIAEGKEVREFDGDRYVMETGIVADLSIVKALKGDPYGKSRLPQDPRATSTPTSATCGKVTVAESSRSSAPASSIQIASTPLASSSCSG